MNAPPIRLPSGVRDLLASGETMTVEFKSDVNDTELVEAVVCLANAQGGMLLVGVHDGGRVQGARARHGATTDPRRIEALVSNSTRPALGVLAELESIDGKPVLVVRVPRATIPTATSSGRYLRRALGGDGRPACVPFFVYETAAHGLAHDPSSALVSSATWDDLDILEIERFRRLVRESGGRVTRRSSSSRTKSCVACSAASRWAAACSPSVASRSCSSVGRTRFVG